MFCSFCPASPIVQTAYCNQLSVPIGQKHFTHFKDFYCFKQLKCLQRIHSVSLKAVMEQEGPSSDHVAGFTGFLFLSGLVFMLFYTFKRLLHSAVTNKQVTRRHEQLKCAQETGSARTRGTVSELDLLDLQACGPAGLRTTAGLAGRICR